MTASTVDLSSQLLLERLRRAREDRGLSQQDVADRLGIARTTLIAIESGNRRLRAEELLAFAEVYDERLDVLLRSDPAPRPLAAQFRTQAGRLPEDAELKSAARELQGLAEDYVALEQLLDAPLVPRYPTDRPVPSGDLDRHAALLADEERRRLGLGDGPLPHLREILESDVGLRIFSISLPGRIAGLFGFDEQLGACIAINSNQRWERQRWSLGHEYAHFLTRRHRPEITVSVTHYRRVPAGERFADHFARHLLLPDAGLTRRWQSAAAGGPLTVATLLGEADWWGVSFQAFALRLEQLRLIRSGTYDRLMRQGLAVDEARSLLDLPDRMPDRQTIGRRMRMLAVTAYAEARLSEERLARMLRTDRLNARQAAAQLLSPLDSDTQ
jgi:Zn-dependent peptidase ImmA (M78 family)/DNA-binding XRE family transcriptional regulator